MCSNNLSNPQEKIDTIKKNIEKHMRRQWIIKYSEENENNSYNKKREIDTIINNISKNYNKRNKWMTNYIYS
jgi:hypothetical protein